MQLNIPARIDEPLPCYLKLAVTDLLAVMLTVQVFVPVQAPDQPVNLRPLVAVAVN